MVSMSLAHLSAMIPEGRRTVAEEGCRTPLLCTSRTLSSQEEESKKLPKDLEASMAWFFRVVCDFDMLAIFHGTGKSQSKYKR